MTKYLLAIVIGFCGMTFTPALAQDKDAAYIQNALKLQSDAWNAGNIDRFMDGYWRSDSLMFIGKSGVTYGWQNTLDNYKKHYPDTATMGRLNFTIIEIKKLSGIYYSVVGRWALARSIGDVGGHFTLLWRLINGKWFIIQDHSS